MIRGIKVKQHDWSDCGPACLSSVAAHYRIHAPVFKIRHLAGTDQNGTSLTGMITAAGKLGLTAKAVRIAFNNLSDVPLPAIAHLLYENKWNHFVVIYSIKKGKIRIMDPASGEMILLTIEEFQKNWSKILLLTIPDEEKNLTGRGSSLTGRFSALVRPHIPVILQSIAGAAFYSILGLSTSVYVEKLVDYVIPGENRKLLNIMSLFLIIILLFRTVTGVMKSIFMLRTGQKIDSVLIMGYYRHLMQLPLRFFETMRVGEMISRVNDAVKIRAFINNVVVELFVNLMIVIFSFILMFIHSPALALNMSLIIPVFIALYLCYDRINRKQLRKTMELSADLESQMVESLQFMTTIKRFRSSRKEILKFEPRFVSLLRSSFKVNQSSVLTFFSAEFISGLFIVILLWTGTHNIFLRELTTGELMSFYALFGYLITPLTSLLSMNRLMQEAVIAADRLFQIMDLEQEKVYDENFFLKKNENGKIQVKNLSFKYGCGLKIFESLSLEICKGSFTAIVGESGSGKSTLLKLIQGIYVPDSGRIRIGEYDIAHISKESVAKIMSCVPQHVELFSGSLLENIVLPDQSADYARALSVCRDAGAEELLNRLPEGLHTITGERGMKLSGGEQQKIALARALYHDPDILLLDEPGSSLDYKAEDKMTSLLHKLKNSGKTIVLVTHRLSSIESCDRIILINDGRISEDGSPGELISGRGHFYQLWKRQFRTDETFI